MKYNIHVMFRIWAKLQVDGRTVKDYTYRSEETFSYSRFFYYLMEICGELDVPTPVLLKTHIFRYAKFNHVVFRKGDFIESFDYDKLILENLL